MQSNRNGFFYVIDRTSGKFIYAVPTVDGINWTKRPRPEDRQAPVDESKRPTMGGPKVEPIVPGLEGGTNWFPMAYNPKLGHRLPRHQPLGHGAHRLGSRQGQVQAGDPYMGVDYQMYRLGDDIGARQGFRRRQQDFSGDAQPLALFSGLLATEGGLVFTGDQLGFVQALDAQDRQAALEASRPAPGINASPITYELDGNQYIAMLSGLGGDPSFYYKAPKGGMLWVFALGNATGNAAAGGGINPVPIEGALPTLGK